MFFFSVLVLDDLEITEPNEREILLSETAKLSSSKKEESHFLSKVVTPVITVSDFDDDDDNEEILDPISDDEGLTNNHPKRLNEDLLNHKLINLAYSGDESTTDDGSERDFSFKDSDEEHDFGK